MCFGPELPEIDYEGPTEQDKMNLEIAEESAGIYRNKVLPVERQYLSDLQENLSGVAQREVASNTAQSIAAQKAKAGPMLANRGQATGMQGTYAQAHGSGLATGIAGAEAQGERDVQTRNMEALQTGAGLANTTSSSARSLANTATQNALTAQQQSFESDMDRYQSNTALMTDLAQAGARGLGNYAMTDSILGGNEDKRKIGRGGALEGSMVDKGLGWIGDNI